MRRAVSALLAGFSAVGLVAAAVAVSGSGSARSADAPAPAAAAGWQGLLGLRPVPQLGDREIVVLDVPSLADRVREAGGVATEADEKAWTREAEQAQQRVLQRLAVIGVPVQPEQSYVRVLNGFSAALDAGTVAALERDPSVVGVFPVRAAYPAADAGESATPAGGTISAGISLHGFTGRGVVVALLDTGIDVAHPYLQDRLLPGIDVLDPAAGAVAQRNPLAPGRFEAHATELAGLIAGSNGPAGLHGVAPGATILPIRVAGWQPDVTGGVAVYGRTDQVLAGIEASVDPDGNGDAHDAARLALVGVVEPDAAFSDGPLALGSRVLRRSTPLSLHLPATTGPPARRSASWAAPGVRQLL